MGGPNNSGQNLILCRFLDDNGDGTGQKNVGQNHTGAEGIYYIQPPTGTVYRINALIVNIHDGAPLWKFYNGSVALTNGVQLIVRNNAGTITDLLSGERVKTLGDWDKHLLNATIKYTSNNDQFNGLFDFRKGGQSIRLDGTQNERLEFIVNDSLAAMTFHTLKVMGEIENSRT